ncbi:hypothetical protein SOVF_001060 [Spinacia oleracea]|nr:hypothetical protein SOVF_001060 [Spinacia oleracea]
MNQIKQQLQQQQQQNIIHANSGERKPCFSFFKLFLSPISQSNKLRIPDKFTRKFRKELSITSILKVPSGETQKVSIVKEDNKLWFQNGWQEFVEYFSIDYAFLLLFNYEGNSNFSVHIFDPTACEISYPLNLRNSDSEVIQLDSDDEDIDDASEVNPFGCQKTYWIGKYAEMVNVVAAAGISLPERPSFVTEIKPYALFRGLHLNISLPFARDHIKCMEMGSKLIKLEVYGGKQFTVKCRRSYRRCTFGTGWIIFAREVGLAVGDVCVFELIDAKNYVLYVHVAKKDHKSRLPLNKA